MAKKQEIRPKNFSDFVGQNKLKKLLKVMISSAQVQNRPLDHILFYGNPGTGKTSLASIISNSLNSRIKYAQGNLLDKKTDILTLFASVEENDIIFVDEIHAINKNIEELLYSILEDFVVDIVIGVESNSKIMRLNLKPFTFIGATTQINRISKPLRDRFGLIGQISNYQVEDIEKIIKNNSKKLNIQIDEKATNLIALYSQNIPRLAINLLKRTKDFCIYEECQIIDYKLVNKTLKQLGIYENGLNESQVKYLRSLSETFYKKAVSLDLIVGFLSLQKETIISEIEPLLISNNLIVKTPRGRKITQKGISYLERI